MRIKESISMGRCSLGVAVEKGWVLSRFIVRNNFIKWGLGIIENDEYENIRLKIESISNKLNALKNSTQQLNK